MTKRPRVIYWIATIWLALGMVSTGIVQLIRLPSEVDAFTQLGYPLYLLTVLGIWKLLGTVAVLLPKFPLLKEWAYAGFFFVMSGAIISNLASGNPIASILPALLLLILTVVSWGLRPVPRKTGVHL
ncbi:MAG: DoxX family protein [Deinococcota bacterium]